MAEDILNSAVKRQILPEQVPAEMRKQLLLRDTPLRGAIVEYLPNFREWCSAVPAAQDDPIEMDVDGITAQGKPRQGKGKGLGFKGAHPRSDGRGAPENPGCWTCGAAEHLAQDLLVCQPHRESMPKANARPSTMTRKGKERRCRARVKKCWK